jgi:hypothetical protein
VCPWFSLDLSRFPPASAAAPWSRRVKEWGRRRGGWRQAGGGREVGGDGKLLVSYAHVKRTAYRVTGYTILSYFPGTTSRRY